MAAIDGDVVSWRFRALDRKAPFVLITSPGDRRLRTYPAEPGKAGMGLEGDKRVLVRALVLSDRETSEVHCRVDYGPWHPMEKVSSRTWQAPLPWPEGARTLQVEAVDDRWKGHGPDGVDTDVIEPPMLSSPTHDLVEPVLPEKPGSDAFRIDKWPAKGVRGDQLGPNRAGRKW